MIRKEILGYSLTEEMIRRKIEREKKLALVITPEKFHKERLPPENKQEPMDPRRIEIIRNVLEGKSEITREEFKRVEGHHKGYPKMYERISKNQEQIKEFKRHGNGKNILGKYSYVQCTPKTKIVRRAIANFKYESDKSYREFKKKLYNNMEPHESTIIQPHLYPEDYCKYKFFRTGFWNRMRKEYPDYIVRLKEESDKFIEANDKAKRELDELQRSDEFIAIIFEKRRINIID